jgi:hypothetical protein
MLEQLILTQRILRDGPSNCLVCNSSTYCTTCKILTMQTGYAFNALEQLILTQPILLVIHVMFGMYSSTYCITCDVNFNNAICFNALEQLILTQRILFVIHVQVIARHAIVLFCITCSSGYNN